MGRDFRRDERHDIAIYGRFRYAGRNYDVPLLDLSETGARFYDKYGSLESDTVLNLRIDEMGPFQATVRWRKGDYVGVQFERPLYGPVMDYIIAKGKGSQ